MSVGRSPLAWVQTALSQFGVRDIVFDRRREPRLPTEGELSITWREYDSGAHHARVEMVDCSEHGASFRGGDEIPEGRIIGIRRGDGICRAIVRHSRSIDSHFITGVELCETYRVPIAATHLELS